MRTSARIFLLAGLALSFAVSTYTQEDLWKELIGKAGMLYQKGQYSEAAKEAEEALSVAEKTFGPDHPAVATTCENMAKLYRQMGKEDEAEKLEARAKTIRSNQ
jgi:tetratricopeptide (TPR) repeat protein